MTHKLGWMALLPSGQTYNWYFRDVDQITNISYQAKFYSFKVCPRRLIYARALYAFEKCRSAKMLPRKVQSSPW